MIKKKVKRLFNGGHLSPVPASRQNIEKRTPSGVRPVNSPVVPVKSDVIGAMKHGGELKMEKKSVKRMAGGGKAGVAPGQNGQGRGMGPGVPGRGPGRGPARGPDQGQGKGMGPGGQPGQGKGGAPGQGKGGSPGQGKGMGPGGKPIDMRYPMGVGMAGMGAQNSPEYADFMMQRMAQRQAPQPTASMVGASGRAPGMKKGGKVSASSYNDMTGGAAGGIGRLEKSSIAAKTKSQKLKKGGKVKGYADGGPMSFDEIIAANTKLNPNFKLDPEYEISARLAYEKEQENTSPEYLAYQARQRKREKDAMPAKASKPKPNPAKMEATPAAPRPKIAPNKGEDRIRTDRPRSSSQASSDPFTVDMRRMSDPIKEYQRTHDRFGRKLDENGNPLDYAGNPINRRKKGGEIKMAKGGKAEAFEGTAKDMAQDKKLAKKRGMSLKAWEKSSADKKHDEQRSMKGLKKGGMADGGVSKRMAGEGSPDPYSVISDRKEKKSSRKFPDFATAFFGPSIRDSADTRAKLRDIGRRTGDPDTRNQEDTKAGAMSRMKKGGKAEMHAKGCKCMACGGMAKYAMGGKVSTAQDGMKKPLRPTPSAMAKGGKVTFGSMKPLPGTKTVGPMRPTTATGASMKKDGMKSQLRAKASGAKATSMMKPLGMTKMAKGGKVRGAGIAQRGTKFIGEV